MPTIDDLQPDAQKYPEPGQEAPEVVAGGGQYSVDCVALRSLEVVTVHAVI